LSPVIIFLRMIEEWEQEGWRGGPGEDEGQEDYATEKVRGSRGRESNKRPWEGERRERGERETEKRSGP